MALENTLESAKGVYRETEQLIDATPSPSGVADRMNDHAYIFLLRAEERIKNARHISQLGAYPSYTQSPGFTKRLLEKGAAQEKRLTHHLSLVGLRDDDSRRARREFCEAFIAGVSEVQYFREVVYGEEPSPSKYPGFGRSPLDEWKDGDFHVRLLDGLVESSIAAIEDMASAVRTLTRIVPA